MRYAARIDTTQRDIVTALRKIGAKVLHIKQPFDLLVEFRGKLFLMDAKTIETASTGYVRKRPSQQKLEAAGWPLLYPTSAEEAIQLVTASAAEKAS